MKFSCYIDAFMSFLSRLKEVERSPYIYSFFVWVFTHHIVAIRKALMLRLFSLCLCVMHDETILRSSSLVIDHGIRQDNISSASRSCPSLSKIHCLFSLPDSLSKIGSVEKITSPQNNFVLQGVFCILSHKGDKGGLTIFLDWGLVSSIYTSHCHFCFSLIPQLYCWR